MLRSSSEILQGRVQGASGRAKPDQDQTFFRPGREVGVHLGRLLIIQLIPAGRVASLQKCDEVARGPAS